MIFVIIFRIPALMISRRFWRWKKLYERLAKMERLRVFLTFFLLR